MKFYDSIKLKPLGGEHCVTSSLKQVFQYFGYTISEEMLIGIGSGLIFTYLNLIDSQIISGRIKVFEFEEKIAKRLNIEMNLKSAKNYSYALKKTKELISSGKPVSFIRIWCISVILICLSLAILEAIR